MSLFSEEYRKEILDSLAESFKNDSRIIGAVLFGSGATGFKDKYSDIDISFVVSDENDVETVYMDWESKNKSLFSKIHHFIFTYNQNSRVYLFLLEGFLELDMGFVNLSFLSAETLEWEVIFDRTNQIENLLQKSWLNNQSPDVKDFYFLRLDQIWYSITHVIICLNRNNPWRALLHLQRIHYQTLELASLRLGPGQNVKDFKEIDQLPEDFLDKLQNSLVKDPSPIKIKKALKSAIDCFFDEAQRLDKMLNLNASNNLRIKMEEYISLTEFD